MAGALKTRSLNDGVYNFQNDTWDVSGTGSGPFIPVAVTLDTNGNPVTSGGVVNPATINSGQQAATVSAVALPAQALVNGYVLKAMTGNTGILYIGPAGVTAATGYPLAVGEAISYAVTNASAIYFLGTVAGDKLAFTGN